MEHRARKGLALQEISPRLQQLSKGPDPSTAIYHLFDLVLGEDKLFSNAIILRLANAFEFGDKHTRVCIVKAFLFEYRKRNKKSTKSFVQNSGSYAGRIVEES
ncbi:uncharacterized protein Pyn_12435 [Prunus yedoensis var. nudiflora]|uniref:Uncharacterized protein n=1 Tax=Prunus yedoensis var. nudiflora TaxID=2094558 RepID=A0A314ZH54_PRUYE|nr:uncharacterized protein Pyn_12435 [Prunus yedoensis var. nudiflora]